MQDLEIRSYLEGNVMPLLLEALGELAKIKFTFKSSNLIHLIHLDLKIK